MPDFLRAFEKAAKAVRFGLFSASDQLALALDGLCRTPEPPAEYKTWPGTGVCLEHSTLNCRKPHQDAAAEFPPAAVADSTPKAVSRPSAKSALTTPAEGHSNCRYGQMIVCDLADELSDAVTDTYDHGRIDSYVDDGWLSASVDWHEAARTLLQYFDIKRK